MREPLSRILTLGALFASALSLRLYGIAQPPMEFFQVRQYHGALLARGFYEFLQTGNLRTVPPDGIIEPPILEMLAALAYALFGGEYLWIPRLFSVLFWMVGGVFVYLLSRRLASPWAAVLPVAFYLFVPYGVFASRAFMPDPLMVMLLVAAIFAILRYHQEPTTRGLLIAAAATSLAILAKPGICLFALFGAFFSLSLYRQGPRGALVGRSSLAFAALGILPSALYYIYGTSIAGFLNGQSASRKIAPELVLQPAFWDGWRVSVWVVVGYVGLAVGLLGVALCGKGLSRALLAGLWGGYLLFGLTFSFHVHTHTYYSLQLIPLVAISLAPVCAVVAQYLRRVGARSYRGLVLAGISLAVVALGVAEHGREIGQIRDQAQLWPVYANNVESFREIGEAVDHSYRTLVLFNYAYGGDSYGYALMYHGRLLGDDWPRPSLVAKAGQKEGRARARLRQQVRKHAPEYFVISTVWWRAPQLEDLRRLLNRNYAVVAQDPGYVIFDLEDRIRGAGSEPPRDRQRHSPG